MKPMKLMIPDRSYQTWSVIRPDIHIDITTDDVPELKHLDPLKEKMFSRDIFIMENDKVIVLNPYIQSCKTIAGVLMLENNKTYGRTANKKRLLYKCIPDDKHLPTFLIPYDIKIGFTKVMKNKFVVFKFEHWIDKHPLGILLETIGDVDDLPSFYEYQLYCKSLHVSLTEFTNKTKEKLRNKTGDEYIEQIFKDSNFSIEDRRNEYIFTIDPRGSTDFDDGYSITPLENGHWKVSIYIANVYFWLETLGLWDSLSKRVATIYLPDRRRPMLPSVLSDSLCSLLEKQLRFALAMDLIIDSNGIIQNADTDIQYKNVLIMVKKNYVYEDPILLSKDKAYHQLFELSQKMDSPTAIKDSHDLVAHLMILMNTYTGNVMVDNKFGIFRSVQCINPATNQTDYGLDKETTRMIHTWNNTAGRYIAYTDDVELGHDLMKLKSYIHITSPIRRLVDLLNQMMLFRHFSLVKSLSSQASQFLDDWIGQLDYLNVSMRSIRTVQTDCVVLDRCFNNPQIMESEYKGVIFDKIIRADGTINYMVYIPSLKLLSRVSSTMLDLPNYSYCQCRIYLFEDEDKAKKKIRVHIQKIDELI